MDRNDARKAAEVMLAYADGKEIEWCQKGCNDDWRSIVTAHFDWDSNCYRIKPGPNYRPLKDAEECWQEMQKHQPFGWVKDKDTGIYKLMTLIGNGEYDYVVGVECGFSLERVFEYYTFADGTPFGIKEEENEE